MARWLSFLLLAGGAFAILAVSALPLPSDTYVAGMASVGAAALLSGGVVWFLRDRLSRLAINLLLPAVTMVVGLAELFDGVGSSSTSMFYVWVVLYAAYFLTPWQATLQLLALAVTQGVALGAGGPDGTSITRWSVTMITLSVAGVVIGHLVGRLRSSLATQAAALEEREELARRLAEAANTDVLTGLPNRRAWERAIERELSRAEREGSDLCVAILDLDRFKDFNDRYGHHAGDERLREAADAWQPELRPSDLLARYGGEEFAVLLPGSTAEGCAHVVERVCAATPQGQTVSAGLAAWTGEEDADELMKRADVALYQAKSRGRDRTVLAMEAPAEVSGPAPGRPSPRARADACGCGA
jgi:diguanylate cyclase (GGDEF)-like protein